MEIKKLKILSSNFEEQIRLYSEVLGLDVISRTDTEVEFRIGSSILSLRKSNESKPYHFAINIPSNKVEDALGWLKQRVGILKDGDNEIQDFDSWNAKAVYFYDKDKNIVEFIARRNLNNDSQEVFTGKSLLEISEIGAPVNDIESTYKSLTAIVDLEKFDCNFERFCAIGDENGLFIFINKNVKDWFPVNDKAYSSEFEIDFTENSKEYKLEFKEGRLNKL